MIPPAAIGIAHLSGFSYTEYLSYFFKRVMGQAPRDYRRSHSTKGPGSAHADIGLFPPQLRQPRPFHNPHLEAYKH